VKYPAKAHKKNDKNQIITTYFAGNTYTLPKRRIGAARGGLT
jgi:hypothetical protein